MDKIVTIENKKDEKFLRAKTAPFDFKKFTRKEINELVLRMKKAMKLANGIGLSANQIGLSFSVFVAQIPSNTQINADMDADKRGYIGINKRGSYESGKFYAVFNPEVMEFSESKIPFEEGCLSVPNTYGEVMQADKITLTGYDKTGKKIKFKARGLLAEVFRHETDHLKGKLFIDRAKKVYKITSEERLNGAKIDE